MVPDITDPIWEKIVKDEFECDVKDFLLRIFLFIVRKAYDNHRITLEKAKQELRNFFINYKDLYDFNQLLKENAHGIK